jgi:pimeloyl-ACP methyl ester carboxylesterase
MAELAWREAGTADSGRLVVAGFSMGGYAALEMLAHPRRRIDGLALLATSAQAETAEGLARREKTIAALERDFTGAVDGLAKLAVHPGLMGGPKFESMHAMMRSVGAQTAIRHNRAIARRLDRRDLLPTLAIPVEIASSRDDKLVSPQFSEEIAQLVPGARLSWIEPAGHMLPFEQPQAVAALLERLLASL